MSAFCYIITSMNILKRIIRILTIFFSALGVFALVLVCLHTDILEVNNYTCHNSKINGEFTCLMISDYHHRHLTFQNNVNMLDEIKKVGKVDAVFFVGDMVDNHTENLDDVYQIFDACKTISNGLFYVTGNHEQYAPLWKDELKNNLASKNVTYLDNNSFYFSQYNINLLGLQDAMVAVDRDAKYDETCQIYENLIETNLKNKIIPTACNVLLTHRPEYLSIYQKYNFDVVIAGHTHGGQIKLGNWALGLYDINNQKYSSGEYTFESPSNPNSKMFVGRGLGHAALLPIRVYCNPEMLKITIKK